MDNLLEAYRRRRKRENDLLIMLGPQDRGSKEGLLSELWEHARSLKKM